MIPETLTTAAVSRRLATRAGLVDAGFLLTGLGVAVAVFLLGLIHGTYALTARNAVAIAALWALAITSLAAPWTLAALRGIAGTIPAALVGLGGLALLATTWGVSAEAAVNAFDEHVLYAVVFALAIVTIRRGQITAWRDGVAVGITGIALVGLLSRLAPGFVGSGDDYAFLPIAKLRLSYPVGYWNALAVLIALALPLLLAAAVSPRSARIRGLAILPIPALAATMYLTSSRGGILAAGVAVLVLLLLTPRRWSMLGAVAAAAAGSAVAVAVLTRRPELVNGPLDSAAAASQRGGAAVGIVGASLLAAALYGLGVAVAGRGHWRFRLPERVAVIGTIVVVAAAIASVHPVRQFDEFRGGNVPVNASASYVREHILSASGNGRWQLWNAAAAEFRAHPLVGGGAGSFEHWWMQHRSYVLYTQSAHSLYLGTLAELGILGLALLLVIPAAMFEAFRRALRGARDSVRRAEVAGLGAALAGFFVAVGMDWVWDIPAVTIPALVVLALLVRAPRADHPEVARPGVRPMRPEVVVAGWLVGVVAVGALLFAQAVPLLSERKIEASQAAVRAGDGGTAFEQAVAARDLAPWAATPYVQLALIDEQARRYESAQAWIRKAIDRSPDDWRLWVISARVFVKQGGISSARDQLARATELNPLALSTLALK